MTANLTLQSEGELPRISVSRSITRKVGDNYEKVIFSAEKSLSTTQPIETDLSELNSSVKHAINEAAKKSQSKESTRTITPIFPTGEHTQTQTNVPKLNDSATGTTRPAKSPQRKTSPEPQMHGPQRVWSTSPTVANLLAESERNIQKDKETFAIMTIREFDDGHDEFLIIPSYSYLVNTGPMGFLRNKILEPQKARAVQRNNPNPFLYEIRESNNGLLKEIWLSCKRLESKDIELNLINPLIWTFQHILHLFRIRHVMSRKIGRREGLCVLIFTLHAFYDMPISFRRDYDSLIIQRLPMGKSDLQFVEDNIGLEGVKVLEKAEADDAKGVAVVTVRRHLKAIVRFPRAARRRRLGQVRNLFHRMRLGTNSRIGITDRYGI